MITNRNNQVLSRVRFSFNHPVTKRQLGTYNFLTESLLQCISLDYNVLVGINV